VRRAATSGRTTRASACWVRAAGRTWCCRGRAWQRQ
jgi:hypothetical protein